MSDRQYEVIKAVTNDVNVEIGGKKMPFGKLGAFRVKDPGVAQAIREKYGRQVTVTGINARPVMERKLHPNRIISPGMPWNKHDELGRIIREDNENALQDRKDYRSERKQVQPSRSKQ